MNQSKNGASLITTRLSPLAKPFTLNRSSHQPSSNLSLLSAQEPSAYSLDHCNHDPFSSLLDSFRKLNLGAKGDPVVSLPLGDHGFRQETASAATTLLLETAPTQTQEKSLCQNHPSLEFQKNGDFDGLTGSEFDSSEEFSLPTYSSSITGFGYEASTWNELSYGNQGADPLESLYLYGKVDDDVGSSASNGSMLQEGKHAVDGLNHCQPVSDGVFNNESVSTIVSIDILSNSKETIPPAVESSSFLISNFEIAPLMLSTSDMSSAAKLKNTPQNQSSKDLDDSDSDVDSPCWKGTDTMAFSLSPTEISGSVQSQHVEKALEKNSSLNPLAPQFFPGSGFVKDDFVSSKSSETVAINLSSGEDILMNTVTAESHPAELNEEFELQRYSNIHGREKPFNMLNDRKSSFAGPVLNSNYLMTQSSSIEDCSTSKGKLVTVVDVDGCVKGTTDPWASGSISGPFPAKGHSPTPTSTTSSSRFGVFTDLLKTLQGVSESSIESPTLGVQLMVNAMHVLSELLVETCADGFDSSNEHDRDTIQQIIHNLNIVSSKERGQRIPTLDSTHTDSPHCLDRSSEPPKGLDVTSIKTLALPHQCYAQNDFMGQNSVSKVVAERGWNSYASSNDKGTERGNEIVQVIRRSLGRSLDVEEQMHPEALLFRNLWLDSEAERSFRRYKTYLCLMEAGMDVNSTNVAELWR